MSFFRLCNTYATAHPIVYMGVGITTFDCDYSVFAYQQIDIESMIQAVLRFVSMIHSAGDKRQMFSRVHHQSAAGQAQCFKRQLLHCGLHPFICAPTEVQQTLSQLTIVGLYCNDAHHTIRPVVENMLGSLLVSCIRDWTRSHICALSINRLDARFASHVCSTAHTVRNGCTYLSLSAETHGGILCK